MALAHAAMQAARDAVLAAAETGETWSGRESENGLPRYGSDFGVRRRKRRKGLEGKNGVGSRSSRGSVKSRNLSPREEAEICLRVKVGLLLKVPQWLLFSAKYHPSDPDSEFYYVLRGLNYCLCCWIISDLNFLFVIFF